MIVFKSYLKIIKSHLLMMMIYTSVFFFFAVFATLSMGKTTTDFSSTKPKVAIINNDKNTIFINAFINYVKDNSKIIKLDNDKNSLNDALFYRKVDYILIIPRNFTNDFLNNKNPFIETLKVPDSYIATYSEMILNRFLNIGRTYVKSGMNEELISKNILKDLSKSTDVNLISEEKSNKIENVNYYFNFSNYTTVSILILIVGMTMASFKADNIKKRNLVSPVSLNKINGQIALGNLIFAFIIWSLYVLLSIILYKDSILSINGLLLVINDLIFTITALFLATLIGNLIKSKEVVSSLSNVIALGSSFLCGAFVPQYLLGNGVLSFARIFPSYWFIRNNDLITKINTFTLSNLKPIISNMIMLLLFGLIFYFASTIFIKRKAK